MSNTYIICTEWIKLSYYLLGIHLLLIVRDGILIDIWISIATADDKNTGIDAGCGVPANCCHTLVVVTPLTEHQVNASLV